MSSTETPTTGQTTDRTTGRTGDPAAGTLTPAPAYPAPRRLTRTMDDRKLGGVCGGIARYANVDATLVRVLTVVAGVVFFPFSILAYALLWALIPADR